MGQEKGTGTMKYNYDIHIHTNLSSCAAKDATLDSYLDYAVKNNLECIGISNHMWDSAVPGASRWYSVQNFEHISLLREEIHQKSGDCPKILFGCETEFTHDGVMAISEEVAGQMDYILAPHSHTHMDFVMPKAVYDTDEKHAAFLVRSFLALVSHPMARYITSVAHPFSPGTNYAKYNGILSHVTDEQFRECCLAAKEANVFLELNNSVIIPFLDQDGNFHGEISRFFSVAGECGCKLTWGSDSHSVYDTRIPDIIRFVKSCGFTESGIAGIDDIIKKIR